ncbi:Os1348 family NHLP clan protein [Phytohabitans rumicis]|uniref:Uncharacterized protein n=1 Tax=Phytohabitans rumicis TaxID=1076125 RepID=A0A6V8L645_9ACTN|nr:Os1348 family NHLP clan protein [Phytohabitans rumicis]GFJ89497.1 hypothetical protein Prum_031390 [Phytohabitans rumicis]
MSDFDAVLERLVTDQAFAAALAADPASALAGYRLSPDEIQLLHSQAGGEAVEQRTVEVRANQSSLFGMLSPLAGMAGSLGGIGDRLADGADGIGQAGAPQPAEGFGPVQAHSAFGPAGQAEFGPAGQGVFGPAGHGGFGPVVPEGQAGFGEALPEYPVGHGELGPATPHGGAGPVGTVYTGGLYQGGGLSGFGDEIGDALDGAGRGQGAAGDFEVPEGYRTGVDMDGDGHDDKHILRGRADGGVDILVDRDRDGNVDIIGHDDDADGHVESAEYDKDGDGYFERVRYDDNQDGWLDRTVKRTPPEEEIGRHLRRS